MEHLAGDHAMKCLDNLAWPGFNAFLGDSLPGKE